MKLLAFDTSSHACSVALTVSDSTTHPVQYTFHRIEAMQQGKLILPAIQSLLDEAGISLKMLDAIAYGCGPGSYTGIRIACSVAQGLGSGANLPLIAVSSLAARAQAAFMKHKWPSLVVVVDAKMGDLYWAHYQAAHDGVVALVGDEKVNKPSEIALSVDVGEWYGVGDGWQCIDSIMVNQAVVNPSQVDASVLPTAEGMLAIATKAYQQQVWTAPAQAIPAYLR